jgi:glutathione synthase/RimK-type ligase-like ATP-grasp enzyme
MLLQPYLGSVETAGERSAIFIDGAFSHAVRKVPVPGDYRVQDDFGAEDRPVELTAGERRLARAAVAAAGGDLLYARVDLLADDRGRPRLSELELVEPSLFFRHHPAAAERLAGALLRRLGRGAGPRV